MWQLILQEFPLRDELRIADWHLTPKELSACVLVLLAVSVGAPFFGWWMGRRKTKRVGDPEVTRL